MLTPDEQTPVFRILDANANRAMEGLRVVEEYLRFVLNDQFLTERCKDLRHTLAGELQAFPADHRHIARDTSGDVGTVVESSNEYVRPDIPAVTCANLKRVEQALRCLEEYSKTINAQAAKSFESIRYETYTLEKAISVTGLSLANFENRSLYVLVDGAESSDAFGRRIEALTSSGVHVLQLRDKVLDDRQLIERARILRKLTRDQDTLFIMNDRPDLAVLSDADGVHVGQGELSVADVRQIIGTEKIVGVSTHSIEQARQAVLDGANYIGVGPTFRSQTKEFDRFTGLELLKQVSSEISLPIFAIGGIGIQNIDDVLECGITRIAVGQAVVGSSSIDKAARELLAVLTEHDTNPV